MENKKFELQGNEKILLEKKGDYWASGLLSNRQIPGKYYFTDQRVVFTQGGLIGNGDVLVDLPYKEISEIKKYNILPVVPTGIKVRTFDKQEYRFSIMKRDEAIRIMEERR